ncbi:MAG TPA: carbohydrate ABC transporter permease [Chloroflexia bacterium]|nr:carbohydrate ABC transporter permease [Chloroflexia bacterium]
MSQLAITPTAPKRASGQRVRRYIKNTLLYFLMVLVAIFSVGPFLWILSTALKPPQDNLYSYPPQFIPSQLNFESFVKVFDFITWGNVMNSAIIALGGTALNLIFCAMAAYPLARYDFPGKRIVMGLLLMVLMLPLYTSLVVNFITIKSLGLQNSLLGVILPTCVTVFGIFLLRQGYLVVPKELEDAGRVDGASEWRIWWQLMLPLIMPSVATLAVFSFVENWNSFIWPLIVLTEPDKFPLTLALQTMANNAFTSNARSVAAGTILSILPILVIFLGAQRFFISGITTGSVKG